MKVRYTMTLSPENVEWIKEQAPGERSLSACFDALVHKLRTGHDPADRLERVLSRLERISAQQEG